MSKKLKEKMLKKMMPNIPMDKMFKEIAEKMLKDIFPIKTAFELRAVENKGWYWIGIKPIEKKEK